MSGMLPGKLVNGRALLQSGVLRFGLLKDGDVRVGVFPECEEIMIGGTGLGRVALHRVGASQLDMGQSANGFVKYNPAMVEDLLKFCCRFFALMSGKIGFSAHKQGTCWANCKRPPPANQVR